jgi:hypothetical protein
LSEQSREEKGERPKAKGKNLRSEGQVPRYLKGRSSMEKV